MLKPHHDVRDPYREWLDVHTPDRPLNAYQLLGLAPGESRPSAIEEAIRHKRELLRGAAQEAPPVLWRHLHGEVNAAAETLRDLKRKTDYDRMLFPAGVRAAEHRPHGPLACGGCDEVNPPTRGFCFRCGKPLLEPCAQCGARSAASETFCGVCGSNRKTVLQKRIEEFGARLREANALQTDGRFDQALVLLSTMLSTAIPQLEEGVEQAKELLRRLPQRERQVQAQFAEAFQKAQAAAEAHEYHEAVEILDQTPPGLRDGEFEKFYSQCRARRDEANLLAREIRAAVAAKKTEGLLEKVQRLLVLKPGHSQAEKLQSQLLALQARSEARTAEELQRQARRLLAEQKYRQAAQVLEEAPETARGEEFQKVYDFARETAWLETALQAAPVADRALVLAAQRFAKLVPKNEQAAEAARQVEAAFRQRPADPRHAAPAWKTPAGARFPVQWLGGFGRLRPTENCDTNLLRERPGCFYVACGLALHGLGEAAVAINLLPKKKKNVLDSFSLLSRKQTPASTAWGIDLSASGLKAVRLARDGETGEIRIDACVLQEQDFTAPTPTAEDAVLAGLRQSLDRFLERHAPGEERVCVALGGVPVLGRFFRLPVTDAANLTDAVRFELRHQIPVPLDELRWDFHAFPVSEPSDDGRVRESEILVLAAKHYQLQHPLGAFEEAGVQLHALQSDGAALYNLLRYELAGAFPDETDPDAQHSPLERVFAVLDVGREATTFLSCSPRSLYFRTIPVGGDAFTKALVRGLDLTYGDAERLKRAPWKARSLQQWDESLLPVFANLVDEVRRCEKALGRHRRIERLYVTGGGAQLHGLLRRLYHWAIAPDAESASNLSSLEMP